MKIAENTIAYLLLGFSFILFFLICYFSEGTFDPGDGISHFLISKFSWQHPHLFFNSWGKPFFTLVSSPFSQFGLIGMNVFNILCATGSAYVCFLLAKKFQLKNPLLVFIFLLFAPIYFVAINSGLTEPFFGLILVLSIYLFIEKKYITGSLLISFLPYVRSEGYVLLFLFALVLAYRKQLWKAVLLSFGTVAYSIAGYFYHHDIFWIKSQNPYKGLNADIYGRGELLHFVKEYPKIFESPLGIIFLAGIISMLVFFFLKRSKKTERSFIREYEHPFLAEEMVLVYGSFLVYFVVHSIFWWKGIFGSLGIVRVMAAIMPVASLICLRGFNLMAYPVFSKAKWARGFMFFVVLPCIVIIPFTRNNFPAKLDREQKLLKETADWIKTTDYLKNKIYYLYPYLGYLLGIDLYNTDKVAELWGLYPTIKYDGIDAIPDGTMVIWDAHFGPNECRVPLEMIMNDPNFKLIKSFYPEEPFTVLGGYNYEIHVFQKK